MYALKQFQISVFDDQNAEVTPTQVIVYTAGTRTAATVYLDDIKTAIGTTLSAPAGPTVTFWSAEATHDVKAFTANGVVMAYGITAGATRLVAEKTDHQFISRASLAPKTIELFDDFELYDNVDRWIVTEDAGAGGGDVISQAEGGQVSIGCDGDDNDECYLFGNQIFKFNTNKNLWFEAKVKLTEAATDDANLIVGLMSVGGADTLLDDGGGPAATYDGACFFKVDGGTKWQFETSNAGTQVTDTDCGAFTSAAWTTVAFEYDYNDGVTASVRAYINGALVCTNALTISGLDAALGVVFGVKAGGAHEEALVVDYVHVIQER